MSVNDFGLSDDIYILSLLHNLGAISIDRSLTIEEAARLSSISQERTRDYFDRLIEQNYIRKGYVEGVDRYHLTVDGIRKVLSTYS